MNNKQCKVLLATSALLIGASLSPSAQAVNDFYVGAGFGITQSEDACEGISGANFAGNCDDKDTGFKIVAGYKFTPYLGAEVGYVELGEFKAVGTASGVPVDVKAKANGFQVSGYGMYELDENLWFIGKLGLFRWDLDASGSVGPGGISGNDTGTDIFFGIGVQWDATWRFSLRAEWERFMDVGGDGAESDVDLISVSGFWRF